jgi:hypothetical protein
MITESTLATAQIAQLFGSELLKVQTNSQTDSGSIPDIVKIDPKQFLVNESVVNHRRAEEEKRLYESLQREAEQQCPYDEAVLPPLPTQAHQQTINTFAQPVAAAQLSNVDLTVWTRIADSLEKIACCLEKRIDPSLKDPIV